MSVSLHIIQKTNMHDACFQVGHIQHPGCGFSLAHSFSLAQPTLSVMEGSILSCFWLNMGLSNKSDDSSANKSTDEFDDVEHLFQEQATCSEQDFDENPYTPAQHHPHVLSDKDVVSGHELKQCREFAEKTCTEMGLSPQVLSDFSQVHFLPQHHQDAYH